ncbi:Phytanoyl-CoA dioxygenase, partial [Balamuthia mandrillaris]
MEEDHTDTSVALVPRVQNVAHFKTGGVHVEYQDKITWEPFEEAAEWLLAAEKNRQVSADGTDLPFKLQFERDGYLVVNDLLAPKELEIYQALYDRFLSGEIDSSAHRHDLGSHQETQQQGSENVCQIMWPSDYIENLFQGPMHTRALALAKAILGEDVDFDFDMLIYKAPHTNTDVPPHQDQAYWVDMPDKRAVSVWVAIDEATLENGCMGFVKGSHELPLRPHRQVKPGHHVLCCDYDVSQQGEDKDGQCVVRCPIPPGSCTLHHGATIHFTGGNISHTRRRAFILNFRPQSMVEWSRSQGFDHGRSGWNKTKRG